MLFKDLKCILFESPNPKLINDSDPLRSMHPLKDKIKEKTNNNNKRYDISLLPERESIL